MKSLLGMLALFSFALAAGDAGAQCGFEHPKKAAQMKLGLVQAFVCATCACGGLPNSTTEGGVPSCAPPETYHQRAGSPPAGWIWDERKAKGTVQFTAAKNKIVDPLNDPLNSADLTVSLKISGIRQEGFGPAQGEGGLQAVARITLADRIGGDMTVVDFPIGLRFTLADGRTKMRTSLNAYLNGFMQPGLPGCTAIEIPFAGIIDPTGSPFASAGVFLP